MRCDLDRPPGIVAEVEINRAISLADPQKRRVKRLLVDGDRFQCADDIVEALACRHLAGLQAGEIRQPAFERRRSQRPILAVIPDIERDIADGVGIVPKLQADKRGHQRVGPVLPAAGSRLALFGVLRRCAWASGVDQRGGRRLRPSLLLRVRGVPSIFAAVRNGHHRDRGRYRLETFRHRGDEFGAGFVSIGPQHHSPPAQRRPVCFAGALRPVRRRHHDTAWQKPSTGVSGLLAFGDHDKRRGIGRKQIQAIERPGNRPRLETPAQHSLRIAPQGLRPELLAILAVVAMDEAEQLAGMVDVAPTGGRRSHLVPWWRRRVRRHGHNDRALFGLVLCCRLAAERCEGIIHKGGSQAFRRPVLRHRPAID